MIDRNTRNLLFQKADLFEEYVSDIMGPPQRVKGYPWGTVWLYRMALTNSARTTPETDFTALVFDRRGGALGVGKRLLGDLQQTVESNPRKVAIAATSKGRRWVF